MKDIAGKRFGKLMAVSATPERAFNSVVWAMRCDCGAEVKRSLHALSNAERNGCNSACPACQPRREPEDLTGQRFFHLVALSPEESRGTGGVWRCRCDCGTETVARAKDLRLGTTMSCGCARRSKRLVLGGRWFERVIPGMQFGLLTVTRRVDRPGAAHRYYECSCQCGGTTIVRGALLTYQQTRSCGCLRSCPRKAA